MLQETLEFVNFCHMTVCLLLTLQLFSSAFQAGIEVFVCVLFKSLSDCFRSFLGFDICVD